MVWGKNLIANASFEVGDTYPGGWEKRIGARQEGEEAFSSLSLDTSVAHSGKRSLHLTGDVKTTQWYTVESFLVPVQAGQPYRVSGWIKTEGVQPHGEQYSNSNLYVQFGDSERNVIRIGRSQVVATQRVTGTRDWTEVERVVTAPAGAAFARVGCVLTCSGRAWFDDLGLYPQVNVDWQKVETDRIDFFYEPGEEFDKDEADKLVEHLRNIERMLDLKHPRKIRYYKYRSLERKEELTGNSQDVHEFDDEIHAVRWDDKHEIVYVVTRPMGASILLLRDGVAIYATEKRMDGDLHGYVGRMGNEGVLPSITKSIDEKEFRDNEPEVALAMAGSFVRYLIEEYGLEKFKKLYTQADARKPRGKCVELVREVYGRELADLEAMWRTKIAPAMQAMPMP